tara:strand:+ start:2047 stop:3612 length:1566 start_codon:yes stop_codon:yes gene_type:complete
VARDDFNEKVKQLLCQQVGGKCAKPDCRITTIGPHVIIDKRTTIGVAAHIAAAAKGGPRFDQLMSTKERKSVHNGIWLCQNHAREIDVNPDKYPIGLLESWKENAISLADCELGQRQLSQAEVDTKAVDTLLSHVQPTFQQNKITSLIQTVHKGVAAKFDQLDSRFSVSTRFDGNNVNYRIDAKEDIPLTLNVFNEASKDFTEQFRLLLSHGSEVEISTDNMEIKGSPLFEHLIQPGGTFKIMPVGTSAVLKLTTVTHPSEPPFIFDDFIGEMTNGNESITFKGAACEGLLNVSIQVHLASPIFSINFKLNWQKWFGHPLTKLPFFNKISRIFKAFSQNALLKIFIEVKGESVFSAENQLNSEMVDSSNTVTALLDYLEAARTICDYCQSTILFNINKIEYQPDDYDFVLKQAALLVSPKTYSAHDLTTPITATLTVQESRENLDLVTNPKPGSVQIKQSDIRVKLLDHWVQLPTKQTTCGPVISKITPADTSNLKTGDEFHVIWEPVDEFTCVMKYLKNA